MYILFEGMPCTGKTTIAKALANRLNADYMKSVVSNTDFGSQIKVFRGISPTTMDYFYLIDAALDELRVRSLLKNNSVIRDKCHIASLGHLNVQGYASCDEFVQQAISMGYSDLASYSVSPDLIVFINPNLEMTKVHMLNKSDCSSIDTNIVGDPETYVKQSEEIKKLLKKFYHCELIEVQAFSKSVEQICNEIMFKIETTL